MLYLTSAMKSSTACVGLNQAERMDSPMRHQAQSIQQSHSAFWIVALTRAQPNRQAVAGYTWLIATQRNVALSIEPNYHPIALVLCRLVGLALDGILLHQTKRYTFYFNMRDFQTLLHAVG